LAALPVFPLPGMVLAGGSVAPLHIFEPRYRAMIAWCLAHDSPLGLACIEPGHEAKHTGQPPVLPVCGVGEILRHQELPDGRYNLIVGHIGRVRLGRELPLQDGFRRFQAADLTTEPLPASALAGRAATLQALVTGINPTVPAIGALWAALGARELPLHQVAEQLLDNLLPGPQARQAALELPTGLDKVERLESELADLLGTATAHSHGHHH
jgi:Lon protease-like protein